MGFIEGKKYRFTNMYWTDKALNVYGTNAASTGRNVCLYDNTPTDNMQVWKYSNDTGIGVRLHSVINDSYVLDRSSGITGSYINNAHLCSKGQTSARDSALFFESAGSNVYRIRLANGINNKLLYLTAANNYAGMPTAKIDSYEQLTKGIKNVYWTEKADSSDPEASAKQCWKAVLAENESTNAITDGTYRIRANIPKGKRSNGNGGTIDVYYYLNCDTANSGGLVNSKFVSGGNGQIWRYSGSKLFSENSEGLSKFISRESTSSAIVKVASGSTTDALSGITFIKAGEKSYHICIGSGSTLRYLTAVPESSTSETISTTWAVLKTNDSNNAQLWSIEKVIKVNNIPGIGTDYFAVWSGLGEHSFDKTSPITNLYNVCFGLDGNGNNKYYNMYGAIFSGNSPISYRGRYHTGIDMSPGEGTAVKAPVTGIVVYSNSNYGTVTIKESGTERLFICMHMTNRIDEGAAVIAGETTIGKVGGIGAGGVKQFSAHLHVEVHPKGKSKTGNAYEDDSESKAGDSVPVYDYF